jgi:hypothetical protein
MGKGWLEFVSQNNSKNLGWGSGCFISHARLESRSEKKVPAEFPRQEGQVGRMLQAPALGGCERGRRG